MAVRGDCGTCGTAEGARVCRATAPPAGQRARWTHLVHWHRRWLVALPGVPAFHLGMYHNRADEQLRVMSGSVPASPVCSLGSGRGGVRATAAQRLFSPTTARTGCCATGQQAPGEAVSAVKAWAMSAPVSRSLCTNRAAMTFSCPRLGWSGW